MISTYAAEISSSLAVPVAFDEYARTFFLKILMFKNVEVELEISSLVSIFNLCEGGILPSTQQGQTLVYGLHGSGVLGSSIYK